MNRTNATLVVAAAMLLLGGGCSVTPPSTFVAIHDTTRAGWKTIELREGLAYEDAWQKLVDVVAVKYDIETMDKNSGYLRSSWAYMTGRDPSTGVPFTYGRRLTCDFSEDQKTLRLKTEAYYEVPGYPTSYGLDSAFNDDAFTEVSGKLGRTGR
jgi:hypothetical protein